MALALSCLSAMASNEGVTFLFSNGKQASFAFTSKPVITYSGSGLTVTSTDAAAVSYTFADVQRFFFEDDITVDIKDANAKPAAHPIFSYVDGTVNASGLAAGESVRIYSTGGALLGTAQANCDGKASISLSSFTTGVYVVSTSNGVSFKINKK